MSNYLDKMLTAANKVRMGIQQKLGTSSGISDFELNHAIRTEQKENPDDEFGKDIKKFFYTGPIDFFKNHSKNIDRIVEKYISEPIDKLKDDFNK